MSYQKLNMMLVAVALLITSALSWLQQDKLTGELLMFGFAVLAVLLIVKQLRWETRELPQPPKEPQPEPEQLSPVVLILGPYAEKWFTESNYTDSTRYCEKSTWLLIKNPDELACRLDYIKQHSPNTPVAAFFPFLPDGHETSALLNHHLLNWLRDFSGVISDIKIPCTIGIYAYLSTELRKHSSSNASWSGRLDFNRLQAQNMPDEINRLKNHLKSQDDSASDIQRAALGYDLLCWLEEQEISAALTKIFTHSTLKLSALLLCDYGHGFTRHGAWSIWLEERYAILPALGNRMPIPPLPAIKQLHIPKPAVVPVIPIYGKQPALLWSICLITLLLLTQIGVAGWQSLQQQKTYQHEMARLEEQRELSVARLNQKIAQLQQLDEQSQRCSAEVSLQNWGLSPCEAISRTLNKKMANLQAVKVVTSAGVIPLFDPGKSDISAKATPPLEEMAHKITQAPGYRILIIGHSDSTGGDALNASLSLERADAVRHWLIKKNIDPSLIQVRGVGATEPMTSNVTAEGRQINRRVEMLLIPIENTKETILNG